MFDWEDTWSRNEWPKAYKRGKLSVALNGFNVANEACLVYFVFKNEPMFEPTLKFELHLIKLECDDSWVGESVVAAANY